MDEKSCHFRFFQNKLCEYYPCHSIDKIDDFNCMFCYCPLYALGKECGGNYKYTDKGVKNCSNCLIPHLKNNYDLIIEKLKKIIEITKDS